MGARLCNSCIHSSQHERQQPPEAVGWSSLRESREPLVRIVLDRHVSVVAAFRIEQPLQAHTISNSFILAPQPESSINDEETGQDTAPNFESHWAKVAARWVLGVGWVVGGLSHPHPRPSPQRVAILAQWLSKLGTISCAVSSSFIEDSGLRGQDEAIADRVGLQRLIRFRLATS